MNKYLVSSIVVIVILLAVLVSGQKTEVPEVNPALAGSVPIGSELQSTTTSSSWEAQALIVGGSRLLSCGASTLGAIIITNESAGSYTIYDATTTRNGAVYGTTTLARVSPNQAENEYGYGTLAKYGLLVEHQSSNTGSSTITFRGNPICQ